MKKVSEHLPDIYDSVYDERFRILDALYQKGIKFPDAERLLEEWGTIAILNSYYIYELNRLTIYQIMHLKRKRGVIVDNTGKSTIHNCINLIKRFPKNLNRHVHRLNIIRGVFLKEFAEDSIISWSPDNGKVGCLVNRQNDVFITYDYGVNWNKLDVSHFYTKYVSISKIQPLVFNEHAIFLEIIENGKFHIFSLETADIYLDHYLITDTDRLNAFAPFSITENQVHPSSLFLKLANRELQNYQLLLEVKCKREEESEPKLRLFLLDLYVRDKDASYDYSRMGRWYEVEDFYSTAPARIDYCLMNQYKIGVGTGSEVYQTEIMQYLISDNVMYLAAQGTVGTRANITRSYDLSGIDYGQISNDIGSSTTIRWLKTTKGYFIITPAMELLFIPMAKGFISLNANKGVFLMSNNKLVSYNSGTLTEMTATTEEYTSVIRGSSLGEGIFKNNLTGYHRMIFNTSFQNTYKRSYHTNTIVPSAYDRSNHRCTLPLAADGKGTILAYIGTNFYFSDEEGNRKRHQGIQCSKDGGITWNLLYELDEDPLAIWYIDQRWMLIDADGQIYYGEHEEFLMDHKGAYLNSKGVAHIEALRTENENAALDYVFFEDKLRIYTTIRNKYGEILSNKKDDAPYQYITTLEEILTEGVELTSIPINNSITKYMWCDNMLVYYNATMNRVVAIGGESIATTQLGEPLLDLKNYKGDFLHILDCDIESTEYLPDEAPEFSFENDFQCIRKGDIIELKSDGKAEYSAIFDESYKVKAIRSGSDKDIILEMDGCDVVLNTTDANRQHCATPSHIDSYYGRQRHFYGRLYSLDSRLYYNTKDDIEAAFHLEDFDLLLVKTLNGCFISRIENNEVALPSSKILGWNSTKYGEHGYTNTFLIGNALYFISDRNQLCCRELGYGYTDTEIIAELPNVSGHIRYIGGMVFYLPYKEGKKIWVLSEGTFKEIHNTVMLDDMCEWNGRIWFVCNIRYGEELVTFLSYQTNLYYLFNDSSYITNEVTYVPMASEGYYGITEDKEGERILATEDYSLHMNLTPCNDFILIWNQESSSIYRYNGRMMTVWKEIKNKIVNVAYDYGITYVVDDMHTIYYSYDGMRFSTVPMQFDISTKIFNIGGSLIVGAENALITNKPIENNRFGDVDGFYIIKSISVDGTTYQDLEGISHEELGKSTHQELEGKHGNTDVSVPYTEIAENAYISEYGVQDVVSDGSINISRLRFIV